MAHWESVQVPPDFQGATRLERRGGRYLRYHPDRLVTSSNALSPEVTEYAADVTLALSRLGAQLRANPLPILYSTSIRSESISSSWIEGIRETPRAVAAAQIFEEAASHAAGLVVRNVAAMREAIDLLGDAAWEHEHIDRIHQDLLPRGPGCYRTSQVWIGGTNPLNADYAGPPHELVWELMDDLLAYVNTSGDLPVVQAAVVHAQFETIHPFTDGNGRVGRTLVHGVLKRAGLVDGGVIPLSTALRNDERGYVGALTRYRYDGDHRATALDAYVKQFLSYLESATVSASRFVAAATTTHRRWRQAVSGVREDASLLRAIDLVIENPVVSIPFVTRELDVSKVTASKLVRQLREVGILRPATGKYRRAALYQADEILDLLQFGSEAGPRAAPPARPGIALARDPDATFGLIHRCGVATATGPCRNRVPATGEHCWRHR